MNLLFCLYEQVPKNRKKSDNYIFREETSMLNDYYRICNRVVHVLLEQGTLIDLSSTIYIEMDRPDQLGASIMILTPDVLITILREIVENGTAHR